MTRPLTVMMIPDGRDPREPFTRGLRSALAREGVEVQALSLPRLLRRRHPTVLHVHWPEAHANDPRATRAIARTTAFVALLALCRFRGVRVVWTVHNLGSHERRRPRLERVLLGATARWTDAWVAPSETCEREVARWSPDLAGRPHVRSCIAAPAPSGVPAAVRRTGLRRPILLHFGQLRAYKGITALVADVRARRTGELSLVVLGSGAGGGLADELRTEAAGDDRIRLLLGEYEDELLDGWLAASDVAVFPFEGVLHSGAVMRCLVAGRPVVACRSGALPEWQAAAPSGLLTLVDDPAEVLDAALERARAPATAGPWSPCSWEDVAEDHLRAYSDGLR